MYLLRIVAVALPIALFIQPGAARAADIVGATYDAARDELVVRIAYRGTSREHDFSVEWGRCEGEREPARAVGRLIDRQGRDEALRDYEVQERVSLARLPCRPALVTLRLGRISHANVYVPQAPGAQVEAVSASSMLGMVLVGAQDERLGVIEDLAVDLAAGEVRYAMVRQESVRPGAERWRGVPLASLRRAAGRDRVRLAPADAAAGATSPQGEVRMRRLTSLLGLPVEVAGERLGRLRDLEVDFETGALRGAVVRGETIPVAALRLTENEVLQVQKDGP